MFNKPVLSGGNMQKHTQNIKVNDLEVNATCLNNEVNQNNYSDPTLNTEANDTEINKVKSKKPVSRKRKNDDDDRYDYNHSFTNQMRYENMIQCCPPKDTLSELIYNNDIATLERKLQENIDPNERDTEGNSFSWTPLYWGVKLERVECVQLLLSYGANINIVVNDCEECCGTVLDLATLRGNDDMENLLREFAQREDINLGQAFKAIRTKLRGKAPAFNFRYYGKKKVQEAA